MRLINQDNEQVGVVEVQQAMTMAREAGLDLVEVAPNTRPPVCRIMDYGKWKYQQRKKEQRAKSHVKQAEIKEVRLRPGTDEHDKNLKIDRAKSFLNEGDKVQFRMRFKGREMAHRDIGMDAFKEIIEAFSDMAKVESPPRAMGRQMTMVLAPLGKKTQNKKEGDESKSSDKNDASRPEAETPQQTDAATS